MTTTAEPEVAAPGPRAPEPRWVRPLVVVGAVLALLLLGGAGGLLIGMQGAPGSISAPAADSVDVGFAQDMTVHHEQAVQMAGWARDHTSDPAVQQLAFDIESTQQQQIGRMQGWLALWNASPFPVGRPYMTWMTAGGHDMAGMSAAGAARMPGMASEQELAALRAATGRDMDVLFLQLMLRHHQGGAAMLADAAQHASVPDVRTLASGMLTAQTSETGLMTDMLAQRGASPLPMN